MTAKGLEHETTIDPLKELEKQLPGVLSGEAINVAGGDVARQSRPVEVRRGHPLDAVSKEER